MGSKNQKPAEAAAEHFAKKYSCSQAIIMAFASRVGIDPGMSARIAASFGGGMARMEWTCGAVTGALMVIGLRFGHELAEDEDKKEKTYELVKTFLSKFNERNGTVSCRDLIGVDISTDQGHEQAEEQKLFENVCPKFVRDAAEILEKILDDADETT